MPRSALISHLTIVCATALFASTGCKDELPKYEPKGAYSGQAASMPLVPNVPQKPVKAGDAYTVWGASYYLRSRVHHKEVAGKELKITGYIVKTNLEDAPECAVHETGKDDGDDCKPPIPTFWIADSADADIKDSIRVMGWASNIAQLYDAIKEYKKKKKDPDPITDGFWGVKIPRPLPVKGAKVTVMGQYSNTFTKATSGAVADPIMGLLTYEELEYDEAPTELASLPGMR